MSTPFDATPASLVVPATDGQIVNALIPMLAERDWQSMGEAKPKFVSRIAAVNTVLRWATEPMADATPAEVSRVVNGTVGRTASHGTKVNAILGYLAADHEDDAATYAPLSKEGASKLIGWLSTMPRRDRVELVKAATASQRTEDFAEVPAGRYAVATNDGAINELAFYKIDRPETGKWAGYVFVKHLVGDDEQRLSRAAGAAVLAKIAAVGPEAAMAAYGHEIGECGMCARTLTNDESRARGIGPICATKAGW